MTDLFFTLVFMAGMGFFLGKLFKGLNPFKVVIGLFFILFPAATFLSEVDNYWFTGVFVIGFLLNYANPFSGLRGSFGSLETWWLYRQAVRQNKAEVEDNLRDQKRQAEDDLRRQKHQAEDDLNRQRQQAEDELNRQKEQTAQQFQREAEELRRERDRLNREQNRQRQNDNAESEFKDTRSPEEVLGLKADFTEIDLKKAYKALWNRYHPDKHANRPEHIKKMNEAEFKAITEAYRKLSKEKN